MSSEFFYHITLSELDYIRLMRLVLKHGEGVGADTRTALADADLVYRPQDSTATDAHGPES